MKEREPLNFASTTRAPPVGRRCAILGGGIFNRNYGEFSTGVDSPQEQCAESRISNGLFAAIAQAGCDPHDCIGRLVVLDAFTAKLS